MGRASSKRTISRRPTVAGHRCPPLFLGTAHSPIRPNRAHPREPIPQRETGAPGPVRELSIQRIRRTLPDAGDGRTATDGRHRSSSPGEALPPNRSPAPARRAPPSGPPTLPFVRADRVSRQDTVTKHGVPPGSRLAGSLVRDARPELPTRGPPRGPPPPAAAGERSGPRGVSAHETRAAFLRLSSPGPTSPRPLRRYGVRVHDAAYKDLFSRPRMVEDLLRGFAAREWSDALDLSTLEKLPAEYVSDDLRRRHGDVVWRVRFRDRKWLYLLVMLEFQSTTDRYMAVRILVYTGLPYQDLIRRKALGRRRAAAPGAAECCTTDAPAGPPRSRQGTSSPRPGRRWPPSSRRSATSCLTRGDGGRTICRAAIWQRRWSRCGVQDRRAVRTRRSAPS